MRKLALLFMVVLASGATAMASDIAISTQAGWMGQGTADTESQKIVDNVKGVSIQVFTPVQLDALATWVKDHTGDGTPDLLVMFGNFPATIYPAGNAQPNGSIAELFLDDGNVIINTGDYIFYVGSNGNNDAGGLQNMMDVGGAAMWGDDSGATVFVPTADGRLYTPSLPTLPSNRPWIPSQFAGTNWEVELILAQNSDGSQVHPAILHNTLTDGRLGVFFQWSDDAQPRGQVISEWINNWFLKFVAAGNPYARRPDPKDGAVITQTWLSMSWTPGDFALSHDVYMGESFEDVNSGAGTLRGNVATPFFMVGLGLPGDPYPAGLVPGTTYYWRVDEVSPADPNSPWKGPVWSFSIPPRKAYQPVPGDGAKYVDTAPTLKWNAGLSAKLHYVYFGDNADTVANATGGAPRGVPNYTPAGPLVKGKTYYWRVDEFDAATTHKGDVWSFTTVPDIQITNPDLVGWWKFDEGQGTRALDFSGHDNDGALRGDPLWVDGVMDGGLYLSGNDYVVIDGVDDDITSTNLTMSIWIKTTQSSEGELFALNESDSDYALLFGIQGGNPYRWDTADEQYPPAVNDDQWHMLTYVRNGSTAYIYVDGVVRATQSTAFTLDTVTRWSIGQEWDTAASDLYSGTVDDARIYKKALTADEVKQLMRGDLLRAWNPSPPNWSTVGIEKATSVTWSKGDKASQHDVYFGLDKAAVAGADASDTTGFYRGRQSTTSYTPPEGIPFSSGPYYWRIDEINTDGTITTGAIWSFSVADYALVEDFESYNDIPAGQPGSNLVYMTWLDGYGTTTNGSAMGYLQGASMETANVHGGAKSVPLIYNNGGTFAFSEAECTFAAENWTANGVKTLSLWFCGASANVPGQLYVKINGVKVLYDGEAGNLKKPIWQVWNIDLATVGVNLQSVTRLAIGIDTKNATGTLLLDDIRLYPNTRQLVTPVQPDPAGLVARYAFEGNANDSAGGHNGTPNGNPTYALGKIGQAISLDGLDDNVVVGNVGISGAAPRTIAGWAKMNVTTGIPSWTNVFGLSGAGTNNLHFDIEVVGSTAATTAGYYGVHVHGWERNIMPPDLEWHHFAAAYDGTTISWYGDGLLAGSAARPNLNTTGNLRIGNRQDNTNFFPGLVDEVQVYSRVLSDAEVAGLAGVTKPFDKPF